MMLRRNTFRGSGVGERRRFKCDGVRRQLLRCRVLALSPQMCDQDRAKQKPGDNY